MKKCPFCAEEIQDEAILCRYCRRELEVKLPPDEGKACPYCAEWIRAEAIVCRFCGRDVGPLIKTAQDTDNDQRVIHQGTQPLPPKIERYVRDLLDLSTHSRRRSYAISALGDLPFAYSRVIKTLVAVSKNDTDAEIRTQAVLALKALRDKPLAQANEEAPNLETKTSSKKSSETTWLQDISNDAYKEVRSSEESKPRISKPITPISTNFRGQSFCEACGTRAPTKYVEFYENKGALVIRFRKSIKGRLCKNCIDRFFWQFTGTTLFLGWWGVISFIATPFILLNNIFRYIGTLGMEKSGYSSSNGGTNIWRLIVLIGLIVGGGIFIDMINPSQISSQAVNTCKQSEVDRWFEHTEYWLVQSINDAGSWDEYTSSFEFSNLASHAENRYRQQHRQETPYCLENLHRMVIDYFYYEWKCYEAASENDFFLAADYAEKAEDIGERISQEKKRFEAEYGW